MTTYFFSGHASLQIITWEAQKMDNWNIDSIYYTLGWFILLQ